MPDLFKVSGYSVSFLSGDRLHGVHVHISRGNYRDMAKFILTSSGKVVLARNKAGLSRTEIEKIRSGLQLKYDIIVNDWDSMFDGAHHFDK
ncbi:DUF4160 domain-containing protein [Bifidobacterium sp. ESL0769]|uniref:DUF4160 domain-containing protein n=1 Tax=Bifidobacterium sp. ESL0769 TaxID=2983229 RepID=UPI0023F97B84|nr:DUF4160 domain-containing protein [Bifidobacterium sp. ESL0769]WEV67621.1 DUF4160 domain-containing protein [Bifidobacterium sp. ESL0769]